VATTLSSELNPTAEKAHLATIAAIAGRLASGEPTRKILQDVLDITSPALGAVSLSLWFVTPHGMELAAETGADTPGLGELADAVARNGSAPPDGLQVVPLDFGWRRLAFLAAAVSEQLDEDQRVLFACAAHLLAPMIANAERSSQLEDEVQLRMRQVEEQRRFTQLIVDSLPVGLYVIDREYRISAWNRKREMGLQGIAREEAIGRTIFEILHRQPADLLRSEFEEVFRTGRMQQFQMESHATGDLRTFRISKIPMRLDASEVTHVITIGEDITDWLEARDRVSQTEKLAAIGQLAAGVMHEINNPLATISACAESLLHPSEDGSVGVAEHVSIIESEVQRCKRIIDGLLDFSRPRARTREALPVHQVVQRTLFLLNHHARFKQVTVRRELGSDVPPVYASAEQLIQVLMALLLNAADAMKGRGVVLLRSSFIAGPLDQVVIEVVDEGGGIPKPQLAKIFEPFYSTKEPGQGTGLGLAICYGIISDHGGKIEVDSVIGRGTTFRILLPAAVLT
jgi:two-component system, NtrC family, sensor kinase